jgi:hypothetical protein
LSPFLTILSLFNFSSYFIFFFLTLLFHLSNSLHYLLYDCWFW